ncbi:C-C motif chemokine 20 [Brachyhypopomus gauderio]|uniref:C-C motif chemokine 20 n=1 Tax=Brachyhypopomus gauderio TaxID=698409 RepID=UPI0040415E5B
MSLRLLVTITAVAFWVLCTLCVTSAAYGPLNHACCVKYTRTPLSLGMVKGFYEQSSLEVCRINAIVFLTKRNKKVCASMEDEWVRKIMKHLSDKMKEMSKRKPKNAAIDTFSDWTTIRSV